MARSRYLRSLAGPPRGSASLLHPPRVSPGAGARNADAFSDAVDASEPAPVPGVSHLDSSSALTGPVKPQYTSIPTTSEVHQAPARNLREGESTTLPSAKPVASRKTKSTTASVPQVSAAVHAEPRPMPQPIRPVSSEPAQASERTPKMPRPGQRATAQSQSALGESTSQATVTSTDSVRGSRSVVPAQPANPAAILPAPPRKDLSLPPKDQVVAAASLAREETSKKIPEVWKGKLWASEDELFENIGRSRRPLTPRMPLTPPMTESRSASTVKAEDSRPGKSVHIGSVEIHVTPPPAAAPRQSAPSAAVAATVLSRGLTSAFGFTQG
jgi:hypothetical protein